MMNEGTAAAVVPACLSLGQSVISCDRPAGASYITEVCCE